MDLGLAGRTAIITGGTAGIGAGITEALASEGVNIAAVYRSSPEQSQFFLRHIESVYKVSAIGIQDDISIESNCKDAYDRAIDRFGTIDILINNAAGGAVNKPLEEVTLDEWNTTMNGCLTNVFLMTRRFIAECKRNKHEGCIVNVSAKAGLHGSGKNKVPYATAKGAVAMMTRSLAKDVIDDGIRVNAIIPGYVETRYYSEHSEVRDEVTKKLHVGWATPQDMGSIVTYLCSDMSKQIVGALIDCTGGTM